MRIRLRYLSLFFVSTCLACLLLSPVFYVDDIRVEGAQFIAEQDIQRYTQPFSGKNVFLTWFFYDVKSFLANHLEVIQSSKYHYKWPNHLSVSIVEKQPWVSFLVEGKSVLVAGDGTLLSDGSRELSLGFSEDVWIISGFPGSYFLDPKMPGDLIEHIHRVVDAITQHYQQASLQLAYRGDDNWALIQDDTLPIIIGSLDHLDEKFQALQSFFVYYEGLARKKPLSGIDLRIPSKLFVTYAK